jgi:hypothetical protein
LQSHQAGHAPAAQPLQTPADAHIQLVEHSWLDATHVTDRKTESLNVQIQVPPSFGSGTHIHPKTETNV